MPRTQSPIILSQQKKVHLDRAEVVVLRDHLEDWKSVKGKERSRVLIAIYKEASLQAPTKDRAILKAQKKVAPPDVQAELAESKGAEMIEHFATEMFKQAGMRVCVLSAWNNSKGKLMLGGHDFNEQFGNGESFIKTRDWDVIFMPEWGEYAGEQFGLDVEDGEEPQMVKSKKRQPWKLIELEEDTDGWPMLPNTTGWNHAEQQHMIQSFLTKLYWMCGGEDTAKSAVPWGDVSKDPSAFFDSTNWPAGVQFKEPSKMDISDASALLQFWWAWQEQNIQTAFSFMVWQDSDGEICEAVVYPAPQPAAMNGNRTQPTQQKGKHKGNVLPSRRTIKDSSSEEDELYGDDGHSSSEDDEPLFTARRKDVTLPPQATLPANKPCKFKSNTAPPRRSAWQTPTAIGDVPKSEVATNNKEPARPHKKAMKQPSRPLAAVMRSKEVTYATNDLPRGSKHHAPEAVRDTPAKRTRSKTFALEASLGKCGKK
ncbi:hypothetical protein EV424DRAFT_1351201 [Suillus variegatus]|nr:hypothetical protein EV424DRAFT_1351201 [Suillus variegatus]